MTSASTPAGTDAFTYYNNNALDTTSGPSGSSTYTYNGDGLPQTVADAAGTTSYAYDGADRPATEQDPLTGATLTWAYNVDSNPASVSYATGGAQGPVQAYGYNGLQQLTSDTVTSASGTVLASEQYGYDGDGNVTSQATGGLLPNTQVTYTYDEASRLTSSVSGGTTTSYGYDADGNLTQDGPVTSSYNGQDQVTSSTGSSGTTSYSYDPDGSLASQSGPGGTTAFTSDAFGQMITADGETYGYDALGRLATLATSSATTPVAYAGTSQQIASDGAGLYAYDPSGNETSAKAAGGTGYQALADQHGDITATFSPSATASTLAGWATYTPWGTATVNGTMPGTGYQGDYTDATTGLVHMGARWYDPSTGAFTSNDTVNGSPLPITADGNPYSYTTGKPLTETDPSGHDGPGDDDDDGLGDDDLAEMEGLAGLYGEFPDTAEGQQAEGEAIFGKAEFDQIEDEVQADTYEEWAEEDAPSVEGSEEEEAAEEAQVEAEDHWEYEREIAEEDSGSGDGTGSGHASGPGGTTPDGSTPYQPPAPPPPPQNAYAAGLAVPPGEIPAEIISDPYITAEPTTPAADLSEPISPSDDIVEHTDPGPDKTVIKGTTPAPSEANGQAGSGTQVANGDDSALIDDPVTDAGKPETPTADDPTGKPTFVWKNGRVDANGDLITDVTPQGTLPADAGLKHGASLGAGEYHYVVNTDGSLRAIGNADMWDLNPDAGHASLAGYDAADHPNDVPMAGTFDVNEAGEIYDFGNLSGHYRPGVDPTYNENDYTPLEQVARRAFAKFGLPSPLPDAWMPYWMKK